MFQQATITSRTEIPSPLLVSSPYLLSSSPPLLFITNPPLLPPPGSNPSVEKGSLVVVTFGGRVGGPWSGQILDRQELSLLLGITATSDAIVGKFRTYVAIVTASGMQRTDRDTTTDLYLLFNAWCSSTNTLLCWQEAVLKYSLTARVCLFAADSVYIADDAARYEYVENDSGVIYQGSVGAVSNRYWAYGQVHTNTREQTHTSEQITKNEVKVNVLPPCSMSAASWTPAFTSWMHLRCQSLTEATSSNWSGKDPPWWEKQSHDTMVPQAGTLHPKNVADLSKYWEILKTYKNGNFHWASLLHRHGDLVQSEISQEQDGRT